MRENFTKAYAKMQVAVVRFKPEEFAKDVQVSDDEIAKYYDAHKAELKSEEKRQVKFVTFALTDEQKKLTGKERIDALQKLANAANDFTEALQTQGGNFDAAVQKFHLTPKETGDITQAAPGPLLTGKPQLVQAAFALTKDSPNSNALQTADAFDILHLVKVEPPHPLTQQEARTQIAETLKKQESEEKAAAKGNDVAEKLRAALKSGQSIEAAASAAGVKLENLPAFSLADTAPGATPPPKPEPNKESADMGYIKQTASSLAAGGVSNYVAAPGGGLVLVLEKREEPTKADYQKARSALEQTALTNKGQIVFYEWLHDRRHAAGIQEATKDATATG
jgi:peptidyl-prolyl cis-trans isomerase D